MESSIKDDCILWLEKGRNHKILTAKKTLKKPQKILKKLLTNLKSNAILTKHFGAADISKKPKQQKFK